MANQANVHYIQAFEKYERGPMSSHAVSLWILRVMLRTNANQNIITVVELSIPTMCISSKFIVDITRNKFSLYLSM